MATDTLTASEVDLDRPAVDTVRVLAMDAIQKAGSGHPGTAMALAPARGVSEVGVSCCVLVLVDQSTQDVTAAQPAEVRRTRCFGTRRRHRRRVGQAPVRASLVVMLDVASQDANELLPTDDRQMVQALVRCVNAFMQLGGTHEAFHQGGRVGAHGLAEPR